MINAHVNRDQAAPLWAVLGAPLVGVPLMVALLALSAPAQEAPREELDAGVATEQVEVQPIDRAIEAPVDCATAHLKNG